MTHELKFRYIYGIPGKPDTYFARYFTIEEIEQGLPLAVCKFQSALQNAEIISRDQFTGLKDKNGCDIYEWDILMSYDSQGSKITHVAMYLEYEARWNMNQCWILEFEKEIIGNTHGVK